MADSKSKTPHLRSNLHVALSTQAIKDYYGALQDAHNPLSDSFASFKDHFAPLPESDADSGDLIIIDLVGLGAIAIAAPFFNNCKFKLHFRESDRAPLMVVLCRSQQAALLRGKPTHS